MKNLFIACARGLRARTHCFQRAPHAQAITVFAHTQPQWPLGIQTRCQLTAALLRVTLFEMESGKWLGLVVKLGKWTALAAAALSAGCGARTGLPLGHRAEDAGVDASADADVPDAVRVNCEEAGVTYIYLMSEENKLMRFYPPSLSFDSIGNIACPSSFGTRPFSMAVDRRGIAYVVFHGGELFRVSTLTASCEPTGFAVGQQGFLPEFGMGFSSNVNEGGETLFVVGDEIANSLAIIDPQTFQLQVVGAVSPPVGRLELTGTGDGRLFGFAAPQGDARAQLVELDKSTAAVRSNVALGVGAIDTVAWAFAFWGGDFYFFTSEVHGSSRVHRYSPGSSTTPDLVAEIDVTIVGAGVSTCAPAR